MALEADRSGRQQAAAEFFRPIRRVGLDRQVERRFVAKRGGDLMGAVFAIDPAPAGGEPMRDVVFERIGLIEKFLAAPDQIAQDAIHQIGERRALGFQPRGAHGEIDRGVIGDVEKQDLGAARDQDPFEHAAIAREAFLDQLAQREADRAEAAQGDGDDGAGEAAIAFVEADEPRRRGVGREFLVQRMAALHDVAQDRGGGDARGKPRMGERIVRRIVPPVALRGRLVLAGPAESLAEIAVHSPRDQVGVARRSVSIMNWPVAIFLP